MAEGRQGRWTTARLAAALDVDPSLVRRWRRGERVPALNSDYVRRIADLLSLDRAERAALEKAQIWALQAHPVRRPRGSGGVQQLLAGASRVKRAMPLGPSDDPPDWANLPAVRGTEALIERGIAILQSLPRLEQPHSATVLITHQGSEAVFQRRAGSAGAWRAALAGVMQRGWDLEQLWRLGRDPEDALHLVERMLSLLGGTGEYRPRYFARAGRLFSPYDLLIAPGIVATLSFATRQTEHLDSSLVIHDPSGVTLLRDHFYQLRRGTRPFMSAFSKDQRAAFEETMTEAVRRGGERLIVREGLSEMTLPREWLRDDATWVKAHVTSGWDAGALIGTLRERLALFQRILEAQGSRDIVSVQSVRYWLATGREKWNRFADSPHEVLPCGPADRRKRVERVVEMLEQYPGYQLAFWDEEAEGPLPTVFWQVSGEHTALMVACSGTPKGDEEILLTIAEPRLVSAFRQHFERVWESIPTERREKRAVVEMLRRELEAALTS